MKTRRHETNISSDPLAKQMMVWTKENEIESS